MATSLQHIKTLDFRNESGTTLVIIDECFNDNYDTYFVNITKVDGNLSGYQLYLRFIDSSGSSISASEYDFASMQMPSNTTMSELRTTNTTVINYLGLSGSGGLTADQYDNGTSMYIFNPYSSSSYTFLQAQASGTTSSPVMYGYKTIGVHKSLERVRGFGIGGHSAFYGMKISVYGVLE